MKLSFTDLGPTEIGSVRTARLSKSNPVHALPWGDSKITVCGLDATRYGVGEGMYGVDQAVTCRRCLRVLLKRPQINFMITTHHQSGYLPADHSECQHRIEPEHDNCSDCLSAIRCERCERNECFHWCDCDSGDCECPLDPAKCLWQCQHCKPANTVCANCREGRCECASLGDAECDSVGGRWMDGLARDVKSGYDEVWDLFDPEFLDEVNGLFSDYTSCTLFGPTSDLLGLEWRYCNDGQISVARATRDNDDDETFTEYMIHIEGPGVTRAIRQVILAHIVEVGR